MDRSTHLLTPSSLKALAHPIRVRLLGLLRAEGPATATGLAERLGESSGTTSYHLRQLAAAGFVVEDSSRGNNRDRWWRAAQESTRLETDKMDDDPETQSALQTYLLAVTRASAAKLNRWLDTASSFPKKWQRVGTVSDFNLSLSAAELGRLAQQLEDVVESYRRDARPGDEQVIVQVNAFPLRGMP